MRRFSQGLSAALSVVVLLLAGCGPRKASRDAYVDRHPLPADTSTVPTPEIGTHGGRFVLGQPGSPKTFNAPMANETSSTDVTNQLFATLVDWNYRTHEYTAILAKSWEVSEDGRTYTFHMRRGLAFSDGHPITSDDVLFTCGIYYDETLHPSLQDLMKLDGKRFEITAPDSYTVVFRIPRTYRLMMDVVGSMRIVPRHVLEAAYTSGNYAAAYNTNTAPESLVTSGPWTLSEFRQNERTVLTRNPYWFRVDGSGQRLPYLDQLVFVITPDFTAAALKFQAGEIDGVDNVQNEDYRQYEEGQQRGNYTFYDLGPSLNTNFFWFNLNTVKQPRKGRVVGEPYVDRIKYAWFSNPEFRRAVSEAVDRQAIINSIHFGEGVECWSTATPGNKEWYTPDVRRHGYDPESARRRLAALGWKDRDGDGFLEDTGGHTISFSMKTNSQNNMRVSMLNLIRDDLAKVGIKMVPVSMEFNTIINNLREDFEYEAILLGTQTGVPPDSPGMGQNTWRSTGRSHYWNIQQKTPATAAEARVDALVEDNIGSLDRAVQLRTWTEMQNTVNDQCFVIWLPSPIIKVPVRNTFGNISPNPVPHRLLWNIEWVFAKPGARRA